MQHITYGPGGYDPDKPDDNVLAVEEIPDPPQPEPEPVTPDAVIASVAAMDVAQKMALREALGL